MLKLIKVNDYLLILAFLCNLASSSIKTKVYIAVFEMTRGNKLNPFYIVYVCIKQHNIKTVIEKYRTINKKGHVNTVQLRGLPFFLMASVVWLTVKIDVCLTVTNMFVSLPGNSINLRIFSIEQNDRFDWVISLETIGDAVQFVEYSSTFLRHVSTS